MFKNRENEKIAPKMSSEGARENTVRLLNSHRLGRATKASVQQRFTTQLRFASWRLNPDC